MQNLAHCFFSDGSTALNIATIVTKCVDVANEIYGTSIRLAESADNVRVLADIDVVSSTMIHALEAVCMTKGEAVVKIKIDEINKKVFVLVESDGICMDTYLEFELYTDVPSSVVYDDIDDEKLECIIRTAFEKNVLKKECDGK